VGFWYLDIIHHSGGNMNKIILVTGGAGFVGSNFIRNVLAKYPDYKIINFDNLTLSSNLNNLIDVSRNPHYFFYHGDITNQRDVHDVFEQFTPHILVNFAAETQNFNNNFEPDVFAQTNIMGTQLLLFEAQKMKIEKFIHISSGEVYGSYTEFPITEDGQLHPENPFAATKAAADLLVMSFHKSYDLDLNIIRSSNLYGPYQFPHKLIPMTILHAKENKSVPLFGDGSNCRNWLHVDDYAVAIDKIMHQGRPGDIYHVASEEMWHNIDLVKLILSKMDKPVDLIHFIPDEKRLDVRYSLNSEKIRATLGWMPEIDVNQGLDLTIQWYLTQEQWLEEIISGEYTNYYRKIYYEET
jgi:dTDP-glucose 4,6-dehydratase